MGLYEYKCDKGHITEVRRLSQERDEPIQCECGRIAKRIFSSVNFTFGWRLSDESLNVKGHPDELVRNI
uniref:Putative regulatory protein FmdB zinc ribbon domain-containing protein n=1 Tax=viral metagenome TaxID=1070528 RepID=A0A6M3KVX2_9ZZZZ